MKIALRVLLMSAISAVLVLPVRAADEVKKSPFKTAKQAEKETKKQGDKAAKKEDGKVAKKEGDKAAKGDKEAKKPGEKVAQKGELKKVAQKGELKKVAQKGELKKRGEKVAQKGELKKADKKVAQKGEFKKADKKVAQKGEFKNAGFQKGNRKPLLLAKADNAKAKGDKVRGKGKGQRAGLNLPQSVQLTAEQQAKIEAIKAQYGPKLAEARSAADQVLPADKRQAMKEAGKQARAAGKKGKELKEAVSASGNLSEADRAKLEAANKQQSQIQKEMRAAIEAVLTPEQRDQLPKKGERKNKNAAKNQDK